MVAICTAVFGLALMGLSQCKGQLANIWFAGPLAAVVGFNWVIVPTNFNIATQRSVPGWVKGRAIAMYMTVLFGSFAVGSPIWGRVATKVGISNASLIAGALVVAGVLLAKFFPLTRARGMDFTPAGRPAPVAPVTLAPGSPLVVVHEYRVRSGDDAERALHLLHHDVRRIRQRNGATAWQLRRAEATDGDVLYEESFAYASWPDRVRAEARTTKADAAAEAELHGLTAAGAPVVSHRPRFVPAVVMPTVSRKVPHPPPIVDVAWVSRRLSEEFDAVWKRATRGRAKGGRRR
jgi:hypothetical protein